MILKDIPGFPGYQVGDDGSVWTCWKRIGLGPGNGSTFVLSDVWKPMKSRLDKDGYPVLRLTKDGKKSFKHIAWLVLEAFVGSCPDGMQCCHNNGNQADDRLENLRWDTCSANQEDRRKHGTLPMGEAHKSSKLTKEIVMRIIAPQNEHIGDTELGRKFNVTSTTVQAVRRGLTWRHVTGFEKKPLRGIASGSKCHKAKLNESQIKEIMILKDKITPNEIATLMGVRRKVIDRILSGETWFHVTGLPKAALRTKH